MNLENAIKMFAHRCMITGSTIELLHSLEHLLEKNRTLFMLQNFLGTCVSMNYYQIKSMFVTNNLEKLKKNTKKK